MGILTSDRDIERLLRGARTIAVVGVSDKPHRDSHSIAEYLLHQGFTIFPVNPLLSEVFGIRAYPDLPSIGEPVDIVDIFRRPEHVPAVVSEAIAAGARAVWMQLGISHPEAAAEAARHGLAVVQDRCIMVEHRRLIG